jgi:hypothetical protein
LADVSLVWLHHKIEKQKPSENTTELKKMN